METDAAETGRFENVAKASGEIEKLAAPDNAPAKTTVEVKPHPISDILFVQTPELVVGTRDDADPALLSARGTTAFFY